jgi:(1->4)-alpha-D-glucan 1-alpha-D-glucosylmutase
LSPDEEYEASVLRFVDGILDPRRPFREAFLLFQRWIAQLGIYNSLAQLVIKIAAPGVPDFYQGTELWDLSLVDPDNRRPVDYDLRQQLLCAIARHDDPASKLLDSRDDGRIKMFTMVRALNARAAFLPVFEDGTYLPLGTRGPCQESVFAFARRHHDGLAIACVPRLIAKLTGGRNAPPLGRAVWHDTSIDLPASMGAGVLRDVFTGSTLVPMNGNGSPSLEAASVFDRFPVALLVPATASTTF